MENLRKVKRNSGITLVALVVTIIVLLILAGITIAMLTGENGIINRAFQAKDATEYAQIEEEVALAWTEVQAERVIENLSQEETADYLEEVLRQNDPNVSVEYRDENDTYEVNYKDHMFEIQPNGELTHNREDAIKDIEEAWENADKGGTEEDIASDMEDELQGKDPDSTSEYNPDSGKIDVDHGGYEVEVDPDTGEITIKDPIKVEKAEVNITGEPQDVEVFVGNTATFTVEAEATGEVTYQWYKNTSASTISGQAISGANSSSYTTPATTTADNGTYYYCEITSSLNGKTVKDKTVGAKLTVATKIEIGQIENPEITVEEGDTAIIEVPVTGGEGSDVKYQWYKNDKDSNEGGEPIGDATSNPLEIPDVSKDDDGYYYVEITQTVGDDEVVIKSDPIKVTVTDKVEPVQISAQPESTEALEGESASFSVEVTGDGDITYQWYKTTTGSTTNGTPIDGANKATYEIEEVTAEDNGTYYYCEITQTTPTKENKVTTDPAKLTVIEKVEITAQPQSQEVVEGQTATFEVEVTGEGNITYQWYKNGEKIPGANNSSYTTEVLTPENSGDKYYVEITQEYNGQTTTITTQEAMLTVLNVNISANPSNIQLYEGGQEKEVTITGTNYGDLSLSGIDESIATAEITSENLITITPVAQGSTTLTITESNAQKTAQVDITVSGTSIDPSVDEVTLTYGGSPQEITLEGVNVGEFEIVTGPDTNVATGSIEGNKVTISPVGAGKTEITIRETNGGKEITIPITIEKATPSLSLDNTEGNTNYNTTNNFKVTPNSTPEVDGTWKVTSNNPEKVTIVSGNGENATNGEETTIEYKGTGATEEPVTITVTFTPSDTQNYNEVTIEYQVTVNKIPATNPTLTAYTGTYDGLPHTIQVQGGEGGTIVYSTDQSDWSEELPTRTENGTTTVYVKVIGDENHLDTEVISSTITIGESLITYESGDYKGTYDGMPHSITLKVTNPSSGITIYYSETEELNQDNYDTVGTTTPIERTDAGETIVYWYIDSSSSNYEDVAGSNKITIDRATQGEDGEDLVTAGPAQTPEGTNLSYNGSEQTGVTGTNVTWEGTTTATNAGEYTAIATPAANYAWSDGSTDAREVKWTLSPKDVQVQWSNTELTYNRVAQKPTATVDTGLVLETISLNINTNKEAINVGSYTATAEIESVTGGQALAENYNLINKTTPFEIKAKDSTTNPGDPEDPNTGIKASITSTNIVYNGEEQEPSVKVTDDGVDLIKDTDYTVDYSNNINAGTAQAIITLQGNYSGTITVNFEITKMPITVPQGQNLTYNGQTQTGVIAGDNYTLSGQTQGVNVGNYTATASLIDTNNTMWEDSTTEPKEISWSIAAKTPSTTNPDEAGANITVTLDTDTYTYDGTAKTPTPTVRDTDLSQDLLVNVDYEVAYQNNQNAGEGQVIINLKGNYGGQVIKTFTINKKQITVPEANTNLVYNGQEQVGVPQGDGYTVETGTATDVNTYTARVTLTDTTNTEWNDGTQEPKTIQWEIKAKPAVGEDETQNITVTLSQTSYTYDGQEKTPEPTVKDVATGATLQKDKDYDVQYQDNRDEGTGKVIVTLKGNYSGEITEEFTIEAGGMEIVANDYSGAYDGGAHTIEVTVTTPSTGTTIYYSEQELNEGNYNIAGSTTPITKTEAGEYTIYWYVHSSDTNYTDKTGNNKITITRATQGPDGDPLVKFEKTEGTEITPLAYNGQEQTGVTGQNVTITGEASGINAGEYTAKATPTANYAWSDGSTGEREITWSIEEKQVAIVWEENNTFTYNGTEQGPTATADSGIAGEKIVLNTTKETNAGSYTSTASIVEVTGGQARVENYSLTNTTKQYQIVKQGIAVPQAVTGLVYNGQEQTGVPEGEGYTITGNKGTEAKQYTAIATLTDNTNTQWSDGTSGEKQISWSIAAKTSTVTDPDDENSEFTVTLSENTYTYDGTQKQPTVTVQDKTTGTNLQENIDYTKQYNNNTNAGTANVTITLKGNYSGTLIKNFTISKKSIEVPQAITGLVYNGQVQTGVANGEGYTLTGNTGTNAQSYTATATLSDTNNTQWSDSTLDAKQIPWSIAVKQIPEGEENQDIQVTLSENSYTYDGTEKRPAVTVKDTAINETLEENTDYTVTYNNNTNAGEAQVVVTLQGNYSGTVTTTFTIAKKQITAPTATPNLVYNGQVQTGVAEGEGYTVQNGTATNQGSYTATVSLIDTNNTEWTDSTTEPKEIPWSIGAKQINEEDPSQELNIQLSQNTYTYDGTEKRPDVTITDIATTAQLQKDVDYTLEYKDNTNAGEAQVIITLQGNYAGTLRVEFTIQISGMEITANDYKGTYDGQPHTITLEVTNPSTGAQIYYSTTEELNESNYNTVGSLDKPTATDAGETTVYWYIISNSTNFENQAGSNKITITQATGEATVTITGTNKIGETLAAEVNTASDGAKTYQWWYAESEVATSGTAIPDANTETYQLDGAYAGKYIGCTVNIAESTNYTSCTASDITDVDTNGTALAWQIPTIEITPMNMQTVVGNSVIYTATPNGTYDNVTYQWYINTENTAGAGTPLGTENTYTYTPETAGTYYISIVATYTYSTLTQPVTSTTATIEVQDKNYSITKNGEVTYYGTLALANADAVEGETITVLKDVTDSSTANIDKTINLDTQSYTITTDKTISVTEGGTLTLAGQGQIQSSSVNGITNTGTITIGNSEDVLSITAPSVMGETYGINNIGTFNFYNGIVKGQTGGYDVEPEEVRRGYYVEKGAEEIENTTYQTAYLKKDTSELAQAIESGQEFTEQKTISDREGDTVTIPKGYRVTEDSEYLVNDGVVISDAKENGNEWVWVPVEDPSVMYEENAAGVALSGSTGVTTTRYSKDVLNYGNHGLPGSTSKREPDLVTGHDTDSYAQQAGFSSLSNMASSMVSEYSTMIDSIGKYGGFYIGRYELTANGTKPGTVLTNTNWYTLYKNCTTLAKSGSNSMSRMIWGAQWDVTCLWLEQSGYDINNSEDYGNYYDVDVYSSDGTEIIKPNGTGQKLETGITTFTRANNVYDLAGNCSEWTQEADYTNRRVSRGGSYIYNGSDYPVAGRGNVNPTISNNSFVRVSSHFNPNATITG